MTNKDKQDKLIMLEADLRLVCLAFDSIEDTDTTGGLLGEQLEVIVVALDELKTDMMAEIEKVEEAVTDEVLAEWKEEHKAMISEYLRSRL